MHAHWEHLIKQVDFTVRMVHAFCTKAGHDSARDQESVFGAIIPLFQSAGPALKLYFRGALWVSIYVAPSFLAACVGVIGFWCSI